VPDGKGGAVSVSLEQKSQTKNLGAKSTAQQGEETQEDDSMDSSSCEDSQEAEQRVVQPLSTDPLKQEHIDAVGGPGQLLCFLQVYDMKPVFGVIAKDVDKARIFGTCIMSDGEYQTFTCHALGVAAATCVKEPYTRLCPRGELRQLILQRLKDKRAMLHDIGMVKADFKIRMRRAAQKQKSADAIAEKQKADPVVDAEIKKVKDAPEIEPHEGAPAPAPARTPAPAPAPSPAPAPAPALAPVHRHRHRHLHRHWHLHLPLHPHQHLRLPWHLHRHRHLILDPDLHLHPHLHPHLQLHLHLHLHLHPHRHLHLHLHRHLHPHRHPHLK
jgi:hypothetical protein